MPQTFPRAGITKSHHRGTPYPDPYKFPVKRDVFTNSVLSNSSVRRNLVPSWVGAHRLTQATNKGNIEPWMTLPTNMTGCGECCRISNAPSSTRARAKCGVSTGWTSIQSKRSHELKDGVYRPSRGTSDALNACWNKPCGERLPSHRWKTNRNRLSLLAYSS